MDVQEKGTGKDLLTQNENGCLTVRKILKNQEKETEKRHLAVVDRGFEPLWQD